MNILTIKQASAKWGISERRISSLCNQGRIKSAQKIAGTWLLPKDAVKPDDARIKTGKYTEWRNKTNMNSDNFEWNLQNLKGTLAVENMHVSVSCIENLKRIEEGKVTYTEVIDELKHKYKQQV